MKSGLVLLLTRDVELEQQSAMAAAASSARLIVARTVAVALEIIHQRGPELNLIVIDFDNGTRGMALLSALSTSRADLPLVALTSTDPDQSTELAHADGAACCLSKPVNAAELEMVIRLLGKKCAKIRNSCSGTFRPLLRRSSKSKPKQNAPEIAI